MQLRLIMSALKLDTSGLLQNVNEIISDMLLLPVVYLDKHTADLICMLLRITKEFTNKMLLWPF